MELDPTRSPLDTHTISWSPRQPRNAQGELNATPTERFRLGEEIARGGMGIVYRAIDVSLARDVAVKVMQTWAARDPALVARFWDESRITAQLQHPGIPPVYEMGVTDEGVPFLAMKLIKGDTLAKHLAERTEVAADRSRWLGVVEQICQAVAYAHDHRVIHRDLKPQNVMVGPFGEVQVMDWGLAKVLAASPSLAETVIYRQAVADGDETQLGDTVGTPAYMPPEQARGEIDKLDSRADVFGLGAILCVVLTGAPPYVGNREEVLRQARAGDVTDALARLAKQALEADLLAVVTSCLAVDPKHRPKSAAEVAEQLARFRLQAEERAQAAEVEAARAQVRIGEERKRRVVQMALAISVMLVLLIGVLASWRIQQQAAERRQFENDQRLETERQEAQLQATATASLAQARELQQRSLWREATAELLQAQQLLAKSSNEATKASVRSSLAETELLQELDEITLSRFDKTGYYGFDTFDDVDTTKRFEETFKRHGWDLFGGSDSPLAERIKNSPARAQFIEALDTWALGEPNPIRRLRVLMVADALTGQSWRQEFAVNWFLSARLRGMLQTVPLEQQSPALLAAIGRRLEELNEDGIAVLRGGCRRFPNSFVLHFRLASHLETSPRGSAEEALGTYRAALVIRPTCGTVWVHLGTLLRPKSPDEALACFREAVRVEPNLMFAWFHLGQQYVASKDYDAALEAYQTAQRLQPKVSLPYLGLYGLHKEQGALDQAQAAARQGIVYAPPRADLVRKLSELFAAQGDDRLAYEALQRVAQLQPNVATDDLRRGDLLTKLQEQGAIDAYRAASKTDPKLVAAWQKLAATCEAQQDVAGALEAQQRVVKLLPADAGQPLRLAELLVKDGKAAQAVASLEAAVKVHPTDYRLHFEFGKVLRDQQQPARAADLFRLCVELKPDDEWAHNNLINCLCETGRAEEAKKLATETVAKHADKHWAYNNLGLALISVGDYVAARTAIEKALLLKPDFPGARNDLAVLLKMEGRWPEAIEQLEMALALQPNYAYARANLGVALRHVGKLSQSVQELETAAKQSAAQWIKQELETTKRWVAINERAEQLLLGKEQPRDAADALRIADVGRRSSPTKPALALVAYEWLLEHAPDRGADFRIEAIRMATQAAPMLDDEPRVALRQKMLVWLSDEVKTATAADDAARKHAATRLAHLQTAADFKPLRDENAELPEAERAKWRAVWDDLRRAHEALTTQK